MPPDEGAPSPTAPPPEGRRSHRRAQALLGAGLAGAVALAVYAVAIEPNRLEVTEHVWSARGLPADAPAREVVVLHLSDLHLTDAGIGAREEAVLAVMREVQPDLIVVTGDTVSAPVSPAQSQAAADLLRRLQAPLGVLACVGNHEDWAGHAGTAPYVAARVPLLESADSRRLEGGALVIHGVGAASAPLPTPTAGFDLLLCHYPVVLERAAQAGFELVLAGHTHGGQVRLPGLGALWLPFDSGRYEQGAFREGGTDLYVSRGVGTSVLPVRLLCRPEVAVHRVRLPLAR